MTKFDKNIFLKPDLITFVIYIGIVHFYKGIIDVRDSKGDPKIASDAIQERHFIAINVILYVNRVPLRTTIFCH